MVETPEQRKNEEKKMDVCVNASDLTDITLTEEESEHLMETLKRGPNEKARNFTKEALKFYEEMMNKTE